MKTSSVVRPLSRTKARNSALINQLATPGLGSLMAGRYVAGTGQLLLALAGFCLIIAWFIERMVQVVREIDNDTPVKSVAWIGELGAIVFALSWIWALVTSISLLKNAQETPAEPPKIPPPPLV